MCGRDEDMSFPAPGTEVVARTEVVRGLDQEGSEDEEALDVHSKDPRSTSVWLRILEDCRTFRVSRRSRMYLNHGSC